MKPLPDLTIHLQPSNMMVNAMDNVELSVKGEGSCLIPRRKWIQMEQDVTRKGTIAMQADKVLRWLIADSEYVEFEMIPKL